MELRDLMVDVERVSSGYAETFGVDRTGDWLLLKLQEEVGELTRAHLQREGRSRPTGCADSELDSRLGAELADVVCHALLIGVHHGVDVEAEISRKWLSRRTVQHGTMADIPGPPSATCPPGEDTPDAVRAATEGGRG